MQVLNRSRKVNLDKKSRIRSLEKVAGNQLW